MSPDGPTASSCRTGASGGVDETSWPATMEDDTGMEINVVYLSSTDYSLLKEEEVSQLALGPQDAIFKKPAELEDHLKLLYIHGT
jgi:hypothetical protein